MSRRRGPGPEAALSLAIREMLTLRGCLVYTTEQGFRPAPGGTRTSAGIPDLIVICPARGDQPAAFTFAELKAGRGRLTPAQEAFRDAALDAGVPWALWRSLGDADGWLRETGAGRPARLSGGGPGD